MKVSLVLSAFVATALSAFGGNVTIAPFEFGTGTSTGPGAFEVHITGTGGDYGGVDFNPSQPFTLGNLLGVSFDFNMVLGSYAAGSPRLIICGVDECNSQAAFVNLEFLTTGATGNSGNLVTDPTLRVNTNGNGFGACNVNYPFVSFASFVACAGADTVVTDLGIVLDDSNSSPETLRVSNIVVDATAATPEPASLSLVGLGIVGFGLVSRKRTSRRNAARLS